MAQFNGETIFGVATRVAGPTTQYRTQRQSLPGVDGARVYRLGGGTRLWQVRGRLAAGSRLRLDELVRLGLSYQDGKLYRFTDNAGQDHAYCLLNSFAVDGPPVRADGGFSVGVLAAVEQLAMEG